LKWRLIETWLGIPQNAIDQAFDQWQVCLTAGFNAKGKHFEHMLQCSVPQLSIICYKIYITVIFVSQLLTS